MLNASMMVAGATIRVYMFHNHQLPVMSPFFCPHEPFDDMALDDICPPFRLLRYPTDGEFNSNTRLTPTYFVESDPSKLTYPTYYCTIINAINYSLITSV